MSRNVALIEDDLGLRQSVETFITAKTNHKVIYSCGSVEDFLLSFEKDKQPDIMFLDIGLPGMSGIEGIPKILELSSSIDIIMLSTYEETDDIYNALCSGACSYVSKRSSPQKVIDALNIVAAGGSYMSPSIAKKVTQYFKESRKERKVVLSERQMEIVKFIADGVTSNEIASRCFISPNTVKTHIKRIYQALNINSKADLLRKYYGNEI